MKRGGRTWNDGVRNYPTRYSLSVHTGGHNQSPAPEGPSSSGPFPFLLPVGRPQVRGSPGSGSTCGRCTWGDPNPSLEITVGFDREVDGEGKGRFHRPLFFSCISFSRFLRSLLSSCRGWGWVPFVGSHSSCQTLDQPRTKSSVAAHPFLGRVSTRDPD